MGNLALIFLRDKLRAREWGPGGAPRPELHSTSFAGYATRWASMEAWESSCARLGFHQRDRRGDTT